MAITIHDITPVGICLATQELFDAKRFRSNFGDNIILRHKDPSLAPRIGQLKAEFNSYMTEDKFLDGHKTAIIGNMDKIISLVSRYSSGETRTTEGILADAKDLMGRVMSATSFDEIARMEPEFKSKITLPMYSLFIGQVKKNASVI